MYGKFKEYKKSQCGQMMTRRKVVGSRCDKSNVPCVSWNVTHQFILFVMSSNWRVVSRRVA